MHIDSTSAPLEPTEELLTPGGCAGPGSASAPPSPQAGRAGREPQHRLSAASAPRPAPRDDVRGRAWPPRPRLRARAGGARAALHRHRPPLPASRRIAPRHEGAAGALLRRVAGAGGGVPAAPGEARAEGQAAGTAPEGRGREGGDGGGDARSPAVRWQRHPGVCDRVPLKHIVPSRPLTSLHASHRHPQGNPQTPTAVLWLLTETLQPVSRWMI